MEKNTILADAKAMISQCDGWAAELVDDILASRRKMEDALIRVDIIKRHAQKIVDAFVEVENAGGNSKGQSKAAADDRKTSENVGPVAGRSSPVRASVARKQREGKPMALSLSSSKG